MKVKLKTKLGRPFWRFGTELSPDSWTEFDLSDEQLTAIKQECILSVADGGALEIDPWPSGWPRPAAKVAAKEHPKHEVGDYAAAAKPKDGPKGK